MTYDNQELCLLVWICISCFDAMFTIEDCQQTSDVTVRIVGWYHPGTCGDIIGSLVMVFGSRFFVQRARIAANPDDLGYFQYTCLLKLKKTTIVS